MQLLSVPRFFYLVFIIVISEVHGEDSELTLNYVTSYNRGGRPMTKENLEKTSVNILKPIIFIIGGLTDDDRRDGNWSRDLSDAYANKLVSNVFVIDWDIAVPIETGTLDKAHSLGLKLADFIETIFNKTRETYLDIHLVGVALGCEVAASAANNLKELTGKNVQRITCLDPFYYKIGHDDELRKLKDDAADFVDVVISELTGVDVVEQIGHLDFYIEGIENCDSKDVEESQCNALTSASLFARSVNSDISARKCDSLEDFRKGLCVNGEKVTFGENVNKTMRGKCFLQH